MGRKHAIIQNYWVIDFFYPESPEEIREKSKDFIVLDIEDQPEVSIDWFYAGNKLVSENSPEAIKLIEEGLARNTLNPSGTFGELLVKKIRDKIGARNLRMGITEAQISGLVSSLSTVRLLLEGAALKTARSIILSIQPNYPEYSDILQDAVNEITNMVGV